MKACQKCTFLGSFFSGLHHLAQSSDVCNQEVTLNVLSGRLGCALLLPAQQRDCRVLFEHLWGQGRICGKAAGTGSGQSEETDKAFRTVHCLSSLQIA